MTIDNLIPDTLYLSGLATLFLLIIYLPIVLWLLVTFWKKTKFNKAVKVVIVAVSVFIATALPLADVYVSSLQMEKYCEAEAGTHIFKKDNVDGFFLNRYKNLRLDTERLENEYKYLFDYGYTYYEIKHRDRYYVVKKKDNEIITQEHNQPVSQYEYFHERIVINDYILKRQEIIKDIINNTIIAKRVDFSYYPGWLDRQIASLIGGYSPPHCNLPKFRASEFYQTVLKPSGKK